VEIAEQFGVSTAWVRRLLQRRRETGDYGPRKTKRGRKPAFSGASLAWLDRLAQSQPDATLAELQQRCGVSCSLVTVSNTLVRLGYRRKKRRSGPLSKTVPM
jgi:transposase